MMLAATTLARIDADISRANVCRVNAKNASIGLF